MRRAALLLVLLPMAAAASTSLRGIMHGWRDDARATYDILSGRAAYDRAILRRALAGYAADAGRIAAQVNGHTASARDFRQRMVAFGASAQAALADLEQPTVLRADFSRLLSDCKSCHDRYNN